MARTLPACLGEGLETPMSGICVMNLGVGMVSGADVPPTVPHWGHNCLVTTQSHLSVTSAMTIASQASSGTFPIRSGKATQSLREMRCIFIYPLRSYTAQTSTSVPPCPLLPFSPLGPYNEVTPRGH